MTKQILHSITLIILALAVFSCQQEQLVNDESQTVPEGYVQLKFGVNIPDMERIQTRAVDPDGRTGIETLKVFCFNEYGMFISAVSAEIDKEVNDGVSLSGTFTANVVNYTKIIHLVGNQNLDNFKESDWVNKSEGEVMTSLIASSGKMVYWGRLAAGENEDIKTAVISAGDILMTRNQARVSVKVDADQSGNTPMTVVGFYVFNTNAFGTIAPYNKEDDTFDWFEPNTEKYTTLPSSPYDSKATDPSIVADQSEQYIFETANTQDDPVNVIIWAYKNGEEESDAKYYRVMLMNNSEYLPVIRNRSYEIHIVGELQYGQTSLTDAFNAAATNNIWISISDNISSVSDGKNTLSVDETFVVVEGDETTTKPVSLFYTYTPDPDETPETVTWEWVENKATNGSVTQGISEGKTCLNVTTLPLGSATSQQSILRIKAGQLQRTIKLIVLKQMSFTPAWVSTEIYQGSADQKVTLMFNIPEDTPKELFPVRVLISTNHLDIRSASGLKLEAITNDMATNDNEYFGDTSIEYGKYKYVYEATESGVQRIYFKTTLTETEANVTDQLTVEAQYFNTLTKYYTYSDAQKEIQVDGLSVYTDREDEDEFANDDVVYYRLVPQKINAYVPFTIKLFDAENANATFDAAKDKFLLYSSNLTYYEDDELESMKIKKECEFTHSGNYGTGGTVRVFYPEDTQADKSSYNIYLKTKRPVSAEVVRIASYHDEEGEVENPYTGNTYKSTTFELANNNPFEFDTALNNDKSVSQAWDYGYQTPVKLQLDITSFTGRDGMSADPFGTAFKVYINAPMLEIAPDCTIPKDKFYEESEGIFVYQVDAKRETERTASENYGITPSKVDNGKTYDNTTVNQAFERKILPFRTRSIVSEGNVIISSQKDVVVFNTDTITISNNLIKGKVSYEKDGTSVSVPQNAFVSFERSRDGTRIGIMQMVSEGQYELRLRSEYSYSWTEDPIRIRYYDSGGNSYVKDISNLRDFCATGGHEELVLTTPLPLD